MFLHALGYDYQAHYNGYANHMCQGYVLITVCVSDTIRYVKYTGFWWYISSQVSYASAQIHVELIFLSEPLYIMLFMEPLRKNVSV